LDNWLLLAGFFAFLGSLCFLKVVGKQVQLLQQILEYERKHRASKVFGEDDILEVD